VVANYLALHGEGEPELDLAIPNHRIGSAAPVQDLIGFSNIRS
jgi:hypothetical protein